jgi:hypothetical protein
MIFRKLLKILGWDGSVRGKIDKGHLVQRMQHPRIFGREHIGQGRTNIDPQNGGVTHGSL